MQLGRLEALNSVNIVYREKFLANFLKQELRKWKECQWKTQIWAANSSSKLSNKGCPLICIKDQTMPVWNFQQAEESDQNGQSVTVISCAHDQTGITEIDIGLVRGKISWLTF